MISQINTAAHALLPEEMIRQLENGSSSKLSKLLDSSCSLIVNALLQTIVEIKSQNYKRFDSNPLDFGCQNRALVLRSILEKNLTEELDFLEKEALEVQKLYQSKAVSPINLLNSFPISEEIEYLLHSYLLTVVRKFDKQLPNGVIITKMFPKALAEMSGGGTTGFMQDVVKNSQRKLSAATADFMKREAGKIENSAIKEPLMEMLSIEHIRTQDRRTFLCFFYAVKTMLTRLKEERALICIKSMNFDGSPFFIFLQSLKKGAEFSLVSGDDFEGRTPTLIFEMLIHVSKEEFEDFIRREGFTDLVLILASKEPPYGGESSLSSIASEEARREIATFQSRALDFCELDHVYLDQLANRANIHEYR
jgi:hypothetical protein